MPKIIVLFYFFHVRSVAHKNSIKSVPNYQKSPTLWESPFMVETANTLLYLFPNGQNWQIGNWQIASDTLIAIIKAQRLNFLNGFKDCITRNICDIPKLKIHIHS